MTNFIQKLLPKIVDKSGKCAILATVLQNKF